MKKILIILLVAFIVIQFFPIDKINLPINKKTDFLMANNTPEPIAKIIRNSCYDCHSNETRYPFYSNIQPVGWFLENHIKEARKKLNFSTFTSYQPAKQAHKLGESAEEIEQKKMPLKSYTFIHTTAKLTEEQTKVLADYFKKTQSQILKSNGL